MDKKLLQRYVEGNASADEMEIVVEWLNADEANVREFMALHKLYNISLFNRPELQTIENKVIVKPIFRKVMLEILKVAAIVLFAYLGFRYWVNPTDIPVKYQTLIVPAGQRAKLILADSSVVWLNSLSKITYPAGSGKGSRQVELDGEAYFEIASDRQNPFVVKTGNVDIKVLGTKFNVIAYSKNYVSEVSLLEGNIELKLSGTSQTYTMKENETVSIGDEKAMQGKHLQKANDSRQNTGNTKAPAGEKKIEVSPIRNYGYFEWINGVICFDDEPVEQIIHKLSLFYDTKIVVRNSHFLKKRYTGKFRSGDGLEHVLRVLQLKEDFRFEKDEAHNVIIIK